MRKLTVDLVTGRELQPQAQKLCLSQEAFGKLIWPICQKVHPSSIRHLTFSYIAIPLCHESSWLQSSTLAFGSLVIVWCICKIKCYSCSLPSSCCRKRIKAVQATKICVDFTISCSAEVSRHGALQASSLGALAYSPCSGPIQDEPEAGLATQAEVVFAS